MRHGDDGHPDCDAEATRSGRDGATSGGMRGTVLPIVLGLVLVGAGGYTWIEQTAAIESYERTEGTVVASELEVREGDTPESYRPDVTYEYAVDGEQYRGSNLRPGRGRASGGEDWARSVVESRPEGSTVTVYYDPDDPSSAYLIRDRSVEQPLGFVAAGALFGLFGLYGLAKRFVRGRV